MGQNYRRRWSCMGAYSPVRVAHAANEEMWHNVATADVPEIPQYEYYSYITRDRVHHIIYEHIIPGQKSVKVSVLDGSPEHAHIMEVNQASTDALNKCRQVQVQDAPQ